MVVTFERFEDAETVRDDASRMIVSAKRRNASIDSVKSGIMRGGFRFVHYDVKDCYDCLAIDEAM